MAGNVVIRPVGKDEGVGGSSCSKITPKSKVSK
jgi:hypothetical protein